MSNYKELLKDKRWKALSKKLKTQANYRCTKCNKQGELHVHHTYYEYGKMPWEYPEESLIVVCKECHSKLHNIPSDKEITDNFYMVFIDNMSGLFNLTTLLDIKLLSKLCKEAQFNTGVINISTAFRIQLCKELNTTTQNISNSIKRLKDKSLITGERGQYIINPLVFWKGSLDERTKLLNNKELKINVEFS